MAFQVLAKTTPHMLGSYSYDLVSREAAEVFVQRSDVWWWCFPVEEDTLDGGSWHRGGAWTAPVEEVADALVPSLNGNGPVPVRSDLPYSRLDVKNPGEDDDDRW